MNRRDALRTLASGCALGAAAGALVGTTSLADAADPMRDLVRRYVEANAALNASAITVDDEVDAFCDMHINPMRDELRERTPTTTTREGAADALRAALQMAREGDTDVAEAIIGSVIGFLGGGS